MSARQITVTLLDDEYVDLERVASYDGLELDEYVAKIITSTLYGVFGKEGNLTQGAAKMVVRRIARAALTQQQRRDAWHKSNGACHHCHIKLDPFSGWHVDHLYPLSKGGTDAPENLVASCAPCNLRKRDKLLPEVICR